MKKLSPPKNCRGQTMIEFAFVSVIFVFMLVLSFNAILAFCTQQYMSYAVFMSARAYQAGSGTPGNQFAAAQRTLMQFVPGLPAQPGTGISIPLKVGAFPKDLGTVTSYFVPPAEEYDYGHPVPSPEQGRAISIEFKVPFASLPLGGNIKARFATVTLTAKSFLGREVSQQECKSYFQKFIQAFVIDGQPVTAAYRDFAQNFGPNMEDNGC